MARTRIMLVLDVILFLLLAMLLEPRFEGLALHEWIGLAVFPLIIVHMLFGWGWIATSMARIFRPGTWRLRVNALLNLLLFIAFVVTWTSGVMTSFIALPALGVAPHDFEGWRILHNRSEAYLEVLAALHVAMNWGWIANAVSNWVRAGRNRGDANCMAADTTPVS